MQPSPESRARTHPAVTHEIARYDVLSLDVCLAGHFVALYCQTPRGVVMLTMDAAEFLAKCRGRRDHNGNPFPTFDPKRRERSLEFGLDLPPDEPATAGSQGASAREQPETSPSRAAARVESRVAAATVQGASPVTKTSVRPGAAAPVHTAREDDGLRAPARPAEGPCADVLRNIMPLPYGKPDERIRGAREAWEVYIALPDLTIYALSLRLGCRPSWLRTKFDAFAKEPGAPVLKPNGKLR